MSDGSDLKINKHKKRFKCFSETFENNKCTFKGTIYPVFKDIDDLSIIYRINGGGMVRKWFIKRVGLNFWGYYYFPSVHEIRKNSLDELLEKYTIPSYRPSEAEKEEALRNRTESVQKFEEKHAISGKTYMYYAYDNKGKTIAKGNSRSKIAAKLGVSLRQIDYRIKRAKMGHLAKGFNIRREEVSNED